MKYLLVMLIILTNIFFASQSNAVITFEKWHGGTEDDWGYSVAQTSDGGYIIGGRTSSFGSGWEDVYLIKTDLLGNCLWSNAYGGINYDYGWEVQETSEGGNKDLNSNNLLLRSNQISLSIGMTKYYAKYFAPINLPMNWMIVYGLRFKKNLNRNIKLGIGYSYFSGNIPLYVTYPSNHYLSYQEHNLLFQVERLLVVKKFNIIFSIGIPINLSIYDYLGYGGGENTAYRIAWNFSEAIGIESPVPIFHSYSLGLIFFHEPWILLNILYDGTIPERRGLELYFSYRW